MSKTEFLEELSRALNGKVDDGELRRQIAYYDSYISSEINNGKREEDVLRELGSPRLIAKTIVQTYSMQDDPIKRQYTQRNVPQADETTNNESESIKTKMSKVISIVIGIIFLLVILGVVFSVIRFMLPIIAVIIVTLIIYRLFTS